MSNFSEQPTSTLVNNLLMDACFRPSPNESSAAVEMYTISAASPPNQMTIPLSSRTLIPISSVRNSAPKTLLTTTSRISTNVAAQPTRIAFFWC